ncbi:MAG: transposase family protein [bacterium]|nr:transposase family protein [bacterium]
MDWSPHAVMMGGQRQIVHTGSIVLCFSRWLFIRHFPDETLERVMRLHEEAFEELDAVPQTMTYDNMQSATATTWSPELWLMPAAMAPTAPMRFYELSRVKNSNKAHELLLKQSRKTSASGFALALWKSRTLTFMTK